MAHFKFLCSKVNLYDEVRKDTWIHTLETKTMLPSEDYLNLREQDLSFQLQVWTKATSPTIRVPDPETFGWIKTEWISHSTRF